MSDVLITGLGIGKDFGVCDANNMNYRELLQNPHVLLWAERVCIPQNDYFRNDILGKEYKLVFEILEHNHILRRYHIDEFNTDGLFYDFLRQAVTELDALEKYDPDNVKPGDRENVPYETNICDFHYCAPIIASLNAASYLASEIGANCLLDKEDEYYLQKRLVMLEKTEMIQGAVQMNDIYKELFNVKLPNESILHEYGTHAGCRNCSKDQQCSDMYLIDVERNLLSFLTIRNYDEMRQLRSLINGIISESKALSLTDKEANEYILREIDKKQLDIRNKINNLFPRVKRFANMVTTVSIPFAIGNAALDNPYAAIASSVLSGASLLSLNLIDSYSSKQNWVNFIDRNNKRC